MRAKFSLAAGDTARWPDRHRG